MYEIVKNVIMSGSFKLDDMTKKINTLWIQNDLTEEQKNELVVLMREHIKPESEMPESLEMCRALNEEVETLKKKSD